MYSNCAVRLLAAVMFLVNYIEVRLEANISFLLL